MRWHAHAPNAAQEQNQNNVLHEESLQTCNTWQLYVHVCIFDKYSTNGYLRIMREYFVTNLAGRVCWSTQYMVCMDYRQLWWKSYSANRALIAVTHAVILYTTCLAIDCAIRPNQQCHTYILSQYKKSTWPMWINGAILHRSSDIISAFIACSIAWHIHLHMRLNWLKWCS